jgi:hypothetical protein
MRGGVHLRDFNQRMSRASCRKGSLSKRDLRESIPKESHPMDRCVVTRHSLSLVLHAIGHKHGRTRRSLHARLLSDWPEPRR